MTPSIAPVRFTGKVAEKFANKVRKASTIEHMVSKLAAGELTIDDAFARETTPVGFSAVIAAAASRIKVTGSQEDAADFIFGVSSIPTPVLLNNSERESYGAAILEGFENIRNCFEGVPPESWSPRLLNSIQLTAHLPDSWKVPLGHLVFNASTRHLKSVRQGALPGEALKAVLYSNDSSILPTEDYRAALVTACPAVAMNLLVPYRTEDSGKALTPRLAQLAVRGADENIAADINVHQNSIVRRFVIERCELSWLNSAAAADQIANGPLSLTRWKKHERATRSEFRLMLERLLKPTPAGSTDYTRGLGISQLPGFDVYSTDLAILKPIFARGIGLDDGHFYILNRVSGMRALVDKQTTPEVGRELLHDLLLGSLDELRQQVNPERRAYEAIGLIDLAVGVTGSHVPGFPDQGKFDICADPDFVVEMLSGEDFKAILDGSQDAVNPRLCLFDAITKNMDYARIPAETAQSIKRALITAGAISLEGMPKSTLTVPMVGEALRRDPSRLSEVKHADVFEKLARLLDIPIVMPSTNVAKHGAPSDAGIGFTFPPKLPDATDAPRGRVRRSRP